jgi:hypothetical protein
VTQKVDAFVTLKQLQTLFPNEKLTIHETDGQDDPEMADVPEGDRVPKTSYISFSDAFTGVIESGTIYEGNVKHNDAPSEARISALKGLQLRVDSVRDAGDTSMDSYTNRDRTLLDDDGAVTGIVITFNAGLSLRACSPVESEGSSSEKANATLSMFTLNRISTVF